MYLFFQYFLFQIIYGHLRSKEINTRVKQVYLDKTKVCPIVIVEWSIPENGIGKTQVD